MLCSFTKLTDITSSSISDTCFGIVAPTNVSCAKPAFISDDNSLIYNIKYRNNTTLQMIGKVYSYSLCGKSAPWKGRVQQNTMVDILICLKSTNAIDLPFVRDKIYIVIYDWTVENYKHININPMRTTCRLVKIRNWSYILNQSQNV